MTMGVGQNAEKELECKESRKNKQDVAAGPLLRMLIWTGHYDMVENW